MDYKKYRTVQRDELKNPDYTHIIRDLRRTFLIAGSFAIIMVLLSFVIK
jgi:hypothetical protein